MHSDRHPGLAGGLPALVLGLSCGYAGVAAAAPQDAALVARTAPCCEDPAGFEYAPLPPEGSIDVTIDRRSPLFEFQSGRSFFRAFRLPVASGPYLIEVRSYLAAPASPRTARVFYPVVAVLTDDFLVSRATDVDALRFDLPFLENATAPAYRLTLPMNPANPRERYLVVYTPGTLLEAGGVTAATPDEARQAAREARLGAAATGRLRLTVRSGITVEAPDEAGADAAAESDARQDGRQRSR